MTVIFVLVDVEKQHKLYYSGTHIIYIIMDKSFFFPLWMRLLDFLLHICTTTFGILMFFFFICYYTTLGDNCSSNGFCSLISHKYLCLLHCNYSNGSIN